MSHIPNVTRCAPGLESVYDYPARRASGKLRTRGCATPYLSPYPELPAISSGSSRGYAETTMLGCANTTRAGTATSWPASRARSWGADRGRRRDDGRGRKTRRGDRRDGRRSAGRRIAGGRLADRWRDRRWRWRGGWKWIQPAASGAGTGARVRACARSTATRRVGGEIWHAAGARPWPEGRRGGRRNRGRGAGRGRTGGWNIGGSRTARRADDAGAAGTDRRRAWRHARAEDRLGVGRQEGRGGAGVGEGRRGGSGGLDHRRLLARHEEQSRAHENRKTVGEWENALAAHGLGSDRAGCLDPDVGARPVPCDVGYSPGGSPDDRGPGAWPCRARWPVVCVRFQMARHVRRCVDALEREHD